MAADPADPVEGASDHSIQSVDLYWRPGCPHCLALKVGLRIRGIETDNKNIWQNPADAATVRSVANGNETVPTVMIGSHALVNPTAKQVKRAVAERAPHLL